MDDALLLLSYESLGNILNQLQDTPEIQNSSELAEQVRNAISFHQQMAVEVQALKQEKQVLKQELSDLTREPGEKVCSRFPSNRFSKYEEMSRRGASPKDVYLAAQQDGLDDLTSISVLRQVFRLSLPEAQAFVLQTENVLQQQRAA